MKLYQLEGLEHQYRIDEITDDEAAALYGVCMSFRIYVEAVLKHNDKNLGAAVGNQNPAKVRESLTMQLNACNSYIEMWQVDALKNEHKKRLN